MKDGSPDKSHNKYLKEKPRPKITKHAGFTVRDRNTAISFRDHHICKGCHIPPESQEQQQFT